MSVEFPKNDLPCPHCYGLHDAKGVEQCCARVNQELKRKGIFIDPETIVAAAMLFQSLMAPPSKTKSKRR